MAGSNLVIELPHQLSRRSHYQRVPTRKLSHRCGTMTEPFWPNKSMKPWLMGRLQCTVVHWPIADMRGESRDVRFLGWSEPMTDGSARSAFDPGCVKTPETRKLGEMFSQIARNLPRSETIVPPMAIRKDRCSINFPRSRVFTQPRPKGDIAALQQTTPHSMTSSAVASSSDGTVRLSALAVLRLIASSNLVG